MYPVCLHCYEVFHPSIWKWDTNQTQFCPRMKCNYADIFMCDEEMIDIIFTLNKKGYKTTDCCSGHPRKGWSSIYEMYISFQHGIIVPPPPKGFENRTNSLLVETSDEEYFSTDLRISSSIFPPGDVNQLDIVKFMHERYQDLLDWVDNLPLTEIVQQEHLVDLHNKRLDHLYKEKRNANKG